MCVCVCVFFWDFISYSITLSVNRDNLIFSLSKLDGFYFFFCLISLAGTSTTMFSSSGESGKLHLISGSVGKPYSLSELSMRIAVNLP